MKEKFFEIELKTLTLIKGNDVGEGDRGTAVKETKSNQNEANCFYFYEFVSILGPSIDLVKRPWNEKETIDITYASRVLFMDFVHFIFIQ